MQGKPGTYTLSTEFHVYDGTSWRQAKEMHVRTAASGFAEVMEAYVHDGTAWRLSHLNYDAVSGPTGMGIPTDVSNFVSYGDFLYFTVYISSSLTTTIYKYTASTNTLTALASAVNASVTTDGECIFLIRGAATAVAYKLNCSTDTLTNITSVVLSGSFTHPFGYSSGTLTSIIQSSTTAYVDGSAVTLPAALSGGTPAITGVNVCWYYNGVFYATASVTGIGSRIISFTNSTNAAIKSTVPATFSSPITTLNGTLLANGSSNVLYDTTSGSGFSAITSPALTSLMGRAKKVAGGFIGLVGVTYHLVSDNGAGSFSSLLSTTNQIIELADVYNGNYYADTGNPGTSKVIYKYSAGSMSSLYTASGGPPLTEVPSVYADAMFFINTKLNIRTAGPVDTGRIVAQTNTIPWAGYVGGKIVVLRVLSGALQVIRLRSP